MIETGYQIIIPEFLIANLFNIPAHENVLILLLQVLTETKSFIVKTNI